MWNIFKGHSKDMEDIHGFVNDEFVLELSESLECEF